MPRVKKLTLITAKLKLSTFSLQHIVMSKTIYTMPIILLTHWETFAMHTNEVNIQIKKIQHISKLLLFQAIADK